MSDTLFASVLTYPNPDMMDRYQRLVGLNEMQDRLEKEAEALLRPDLLEKWSKDCYGLRLSALNLLERRPPLFVFAGDVGTGKTELAMTFGDRLARHTRMGVQLYNLSLRTRGSGAVGEMTRLISEAFSQLRSNCHKPTGAGRKPAGAAILLIDEADALAQSREMVQMHHEDRAGVNALIRGIDEIANAKLPCLILMCSNRLGALDPAILRRAAAIFEFRRPSFELREHLLTQYLEEAGLSRADISSLAELVGETETRKYGFTFSDLTQRLVPAIVLAAYPGGKITRELAMNVASRIEPTPPFRSEEVR
jgi:AAA+ superfamily predicted ATPase